MTDNVTSQLTKIRGALSNLGSGAAGSGMERLKRQTTELTERTKGLSDGFERGNISALGMAKSMGLATAGVVGMGVAVKGGLDSLGEYAKRMANLGEMARQTGLMSAQIRETIEAYQRSGFSPEQAKADIAGIADAMAEINRKNSTLAQSLLKGQVGARREAAQALVDDLRMLSNDQVGFTNRVKQAYDEVYEESIKAGKTMQEAARAANRALGEFNATNLGGLREELKQTTAEQQTMLDQRIRQAQEYNTVVVEISQNWGKITDSVKAAVLPGATTALRGFNSELAEAANNISVAVTALSNIAAPEWLKNLEPPDWLKKLGGVAAKAVTTPAGGVVQAINAGARIVDRFTGNEAAASQAPPAAQTAAGPMGMGGRGGGDYGVSTAPKKSLWGKAKGLVGRAGGGPLDAGQLSVVGEQGPELFSPSQSGTILPNAIYGAALAAEYGFGLRGASTAAAGALRGHGGAGGGHSIGEVMAMGIPGAGLLNMVKKDAAGGHSMRSKLRAMLGLEDPNEPAPWQAGGQWKRQTGGPVTQGTKGLVGEAGPELFMSGGGGGEGKRLIAEQTHQMQELVQNTEDQSTQTKALTEELSTLNRHLEAAGGGGGSAGGAGMARGGGVSMSGLGGLPGGSAFGGGRGGGGSGGFGGGGGSSGGGGASASWASGQSEAAAPSMATSAGRAGTGSGKAAAEAYLGKKVSDSEYDQLMRATHAESGAKNSPEEQAMIMGSILNRAREHKGGISGALNAPNQFQAVTGTRFQPGPSRNYRQGPNESRTASIEGAAQDLLHRVPTSQKDFTAADPRAYGPGTNIDYLRKMRGQGAVHGGTQFRSSLLPAGEGGGMASTGGSGQPITNVPPGRGAHGSEANQSNRPGYLGGTVELGGETYNWGSGGGGRGSVPYGTHAINVGDVGAGGRVLGSIAGMGGPGGTINDPKYPGKPRTGMQIHSNRREQLDALYSAGCFTVPKSQWPKFRQSLLDQAAKTPGGLHLQVGRDGKAFIGSKAQIEDRARGASPDVGLPTGGASPPLGQAGPPPPRPGGRGGLAALDADMDRSITQKVEGTGKLSVDVRAPAGTKVAAEGTGLFKQVETSRMVQMAEASEGPTTAV